MVTGIQLYELAYDYLLSFEGVSAEMIDSHLYEWRSGRLTSLNDLFFSMALSAQNKQDMPRSIGDVNDVRPFVRDFNAAEVVKAKLTWEDIFDAIVSSNYTPPGRMVRDNKSSYWVQFCKSLISIADFVSTFDTIEAFHAFVESFYVNELSRLALPLLLEKEIYGFGFALSCDFLKEAGYPEFLKPDVHIIDIAYSLGISPSRDQYQVFKSMVAYCAEIGKLPYEVDKLFWLVGSGAFYLQKVSVKVSRTEFIEMVRNS
ncbi:MAG: hypothetical protein M9928_21570 [Anaerolineae bacterium]|nr:hypothetical protein [Anaerolineae bacterium]MCO5198598.1 hypothetical protein [Anaerolineae bacterium]MCO5207606.1 hypothetical protein [Anaerolineae bacterium]